MSSVQSSAYDDSETLEDFLQDDFPRLDAENAIERTWPTFSPSYGAAFSASKSGSFGQPGASRRKRVSSEDLTTSDETLAKALREGDFVVVKYLVEWIIHCHCSPRPKGAS